MSDPAPEFAQQSGRNNQPPGWTVAEVTRLRENAHLGAVAVARILGRSLSSVRAQANRQRISLRRAGEHRGLILGQPRGESWGSRRDVDGLRAAVASGRLDPAAVEASIARMLAGEEPDLCPRCVRRPANHRSGVCRVCHLNALADAHRDAVAVDEAQRRVWQARQEKSRSARDREVRDADGG